jgi:hypothetical protein
MPAEHVIPLCGKCEGALREHMRRRFRGGEVELQEPTQKEQKDKCRPDEEGKQPEDPEVSHVAIEFESEHRRDALKSPRGASCQIVFGRHSQKNEQADGKDRKAKLHCFDGTYVLKAPGLS